MMFTLHLYREGDRWFFDDEKKSIEHEELVEGVPEILYEICADTTVQKLDVSISTRQLTGGIPLKRSDRHDPMGGVYYIYDAGDHEVEGWLCPVFWDYFTPPDAPKTIWLLAWRTDLTK